MHADGTLEGEGGLGQRDRVDRTSVAGDVAGAQAEFVGELHQRVGDGDVALLGLHALQLGGVRGGPQVGQLRLGLAEQLQPALQAGLVRHVLRGLVEGVGRLVGGGPCLEDVRVALALALEQRHRGDVALVVEGVGVGEGGTHQAGGVLRLLGLVPRVDRALDLEAAHDQADEHGYEQDRVQPGRHPPVARGHTAPARRGCGRGLGTGHGGGRRCARRRREVAPGRWLGTVLASPHSTNNLPALGTYCVPHRLRARHAIDY